MIGRRLKALREARGLSQGDLAKRVGAHINQVLRWEKDTSIPGGDALMKLARELEVSTDYLLGLVEGKTDHLAETDISPKEQRILDAYRHGDWQRLLYEIATDDTLAGKAVQETLKVTNHPTSKN